jgi:hypothetical protein
VRPTAGALLRLAIFGLAAVYLGWWVVKVAAVEAFGSRSPFAAAAFAPDHPYVRINLARAEFSLRNGFVSPPTRDAATAALRRATLSEEPFFLAGVQAIADGDPKRGQRLLEEARRRNPRSRLTRLLLLNSYLRDSKETQAGVELAALGSLIPQAVPALAPELSRMVRDPKTTEPVTKMLAREPGIRDAVLANLARSGVDQSLILKLAGSGPPSPEGTEWQRLLIGRLVKEGAVGRAYFLWRQFGGLRQPPGPKGVYDPSFQGLRGAPPFNWELANGTDGVAERVPGPALQVSYYGRNPAMLAGQLLMLAPGRYRLEMVAEGDAKGEASKLFWTVRCLSGAATLVQIPIVDVGSPRRLSGSFVVPAGCGTQSLNLEGVPGDVASDEGVTITRLQLIGGGSK